MRGKEAAQAARRREDASVTAEIEGYQHAIRQLNEELAKVRNKLAAEQRARTEETRVLRAQRDEGLSPQVQALEHALQRQRERADHAERKAAITKQHQEKTMRVLYSDLVTTHGLTEVETLEWISNHLVMEGLEGVTVVDSDKQGKLGSEKAKQIQRARRTRH